MKLKLKTPSLLSNQKTAIKLVNQYAESYQLLEKDNKLIIQELQDSKMNLQINKSIINDLLSTLKPAQKEKAVIDGLNKEIKLLNNSIEFYKKENSELKKSVGSNSTEVILSKYQKTFDSLNNKIFLLENSATKKDNIIRQLNKK